MRVSKPPSRAWEVVRAFGALPCFLVFSVIFWELAVGAELLAGWESGRGWSVMSMCFRGIGLLIGGLTLVGTVIFFVTWVFHMVRVIRGQSSDQS